jgi:hypothetical protein
MPNVTHEAQVKAASRGLHLLPSMLLLGQFYSPYTTVLFLAKMAYRKC